jgi:type IV pilus assembly protein PilB
MTPSAPTTQPEATPVEPAPLPGTAQLKAVTDTGGAIANLLVQGEHLTQEQIQYARRVQSKLSSQKPLVSVLKELGLITAQQLRDVLVANRLAVRIGDLLVELGHISLNDLSTAIRIQRETKGSQKLGEVLVENQFITEQKLLEVLSYQLGFELLDPAPSDIDRTLFHKAPPNWYLQHKFLPVKNSAEGILVVFADPLNQEDRDAAAKVFGDRIVAGICSQTTISELTAIVGKIQSRTAGGSNDEQTIIGIVNSIIEEAMKANASDIHIEPMRDRVRIRFRADGVLLHHKDMSSDVANALTSRIKILAKADIADKRRHQGGRIFFEDRWSGATLDLRASFYVTVWGEKTVLRLLNKKSRALNLEEVGMFPKLLERFREEALDIPSGVVLITGPTGSGKTTTLYGCVSYLNTIDTSILTAEDPAEYLIDGISQCSLDPKIGLTYEETLRHMVRQDPDVIVVGEIRDRFSADTCIQAALTGHKVMTTFHTEDTIGGLIRLLNMDIEAFLISSTVVCVLAQRLARKICSHCAEPYVPKPAELHRIGYGAQDLNGATLMMGRGCSRCNYTGYKGRLGIFELLVLNEVVKDGLLRKKTSYEIRKLSVETSGLITLLEDGIAKVSKGETTIHEVLRHVPRVGNPRPLSEIRRSLGL